VLTFRYPSGREPALIPALRSWLSGWPGIGRITVGMARQGFDLQLTRYGGEGWRATFFPEGRAHSLAAAVGFMWEREPWRAVQRAAWEELRKREGEVGRPASLTGVHDERVMKRSVANKEGSPWESPCSLRSVGSS
jgi:hypothetical protein